MIGKIERDFKRLWRILSANEKKENLNLIRKFKKIERKLLALQYPAENKRATRGGTT
jgi:hypothetical protein